MKQFALVVFSNPVAGREDEYNNWYTNQHLADVLKVPGFLSAQRFTLGVADPGAKWKYLAIYEFESDDAAATVATLVALAGSPDMVLSEALNLSDYSVTPWLAITDKLRRR